MDRNIIDVLQVIEFKNTTKQIYARESLRGKLLTLSIYLNGTYEVTFGTVTLYRGFEVEKASLAYDSVQKIVGGE